MRCTRCDACLSMWDAPVCPYCRYPEADTRSREKIAQDEAEYRERIEDEMHTTPE